jgi:anti-sigma B factor antagonist
MRISQAHARWPIRPNNGMIAVPHRRASEEEVLTEGEAPLATGHSPRVVLPLVGDLDAAAAHDAYKRVIGLDLHARDQLVLDLSGLKFMDSSGIRLVLQARELALRRGAGFALVRGPENVTRVLELVGLDEQLDFIDAD